MNISLIYDMRCQLRTEVPFVLTDQAWEEVFVRLNWIDLDDSLPEKISWAINRSNLIGNEHESR